MADIINKYLKIHRYSNSTQFTDELLKFAKIEMNNIADDVSNEQIMNDPLTDVYVFFDNDNDYKLNSFLKGICQRL